MTEKIEKVKTKELNFDYTNPRLIEFGVDKNTPSEVILQTLWDEMAVEELVLSIAASGFLTYEPLIVIKEKGKNIVIEGNRRLAAVIAILTKGYLEKNASTNITEVSTEVKEGIKELPVIYAAGRKAAWRFIGFKHVNGAAKWGSYAKAQYIAEFENKNDVPPSHVKDDKLDIVVWKSFADKNVSKLIGFGQCKTGMTWRNDNSLTQLSPSAFCKKF